MLKFTDRELDIIRHFNLTPETIHNFYNAPESLIPHGILDSINAKFWPDDPSDGFDELSLEDVAVWVLTTYLTREQVEKMTDKDIVAFLQNWKYYFGFRKHEGDGDLYRYLALKAFDGRLVLRDIDQEIYYREVEN